MGGKFEKTLEEWQRNTRDPNTHIASLSSQYPLMSKRIDVVKVALRIMQGHRVPSDRALEYARACGHDGMVAFRVEDYDAILHEKWGKAADLFRGDAELMAEMARRSRKVFAPMPGSDTAENLKKYNECVITLRAGLWAMEMFDVPYETAYDHMAAFRWNNMWRTLPPPGLVALEIEDYAQRMLTRRESYHA